MEMKSDQEQALLRRQLAGTPRVHHERFRRPRLPDPPFNSRQDYNVLFAEKDGSRSASQITAFKDSWEWNLEAESSYQEVVERGGRVADATRAFRTLLGGSDMLAYLAMMAPRLIELLRVLKPSPLHRSPLYDPHASA